MRGHAARLAVGARGGVRREGAGRRVVHRVRDELRALARLEGAREAAREARRGAAARARALLKGRFHVSKDDINAVSVSALRHRMILSFEGEAEGMRTEAIVNDVIEKLSFAGYAVA